MRIFAGVFIVFFIARTYASEIIVVGESGPIEVSCGEDLSAVHNLAVALAKQVAKQNCEMLALDIGSRITDWRGGLYLCAWYGQDRGLYKLSAKFSCR